MFHNKKCLRKNLSNYAVLLQIQEKYRPPIRDLVPSLPTSHTQLEDASIPKWDIRQIEHFDDIMLFACSNWD
jgi:hypothetical protein